MSGYAAFEATATACSLLAHAVLLRRLCADARTPVPLATLALQAASNVAWVLFALARGDAYLFTTSVASLGMQGTSATLRWREERRRGRGRGGGGGTDTQAEARRPIKMQTSDAELPRM